MTLGYYPFGLKQKGYNNVVSSNGNSLAQAFKFGGKEYNEELGLNWYDVTARNYDPAIGRWMNLDPLAEKMRRHSPYNFAFDNPIYFQDYDGMMPSGPGDPPNKGLYGLVLKSAKAFVSFLGMDSVDVTGDPNSDRGDGDGYTFVTEDGQPSGDPSTVTSTTGNVEEKDVTGIVQLAGYTKLKKSGKGDGKTNATSKSEKNTASKMKDGMDDAGKKADQVETGKNGMEMFASNSKEPDSTTMSISTMKVTNVSKNEQGKTVVTETPTVRDTTVTVGQEGNVRSFENQENLKSMNNVKSILNGSN